MEHAQHRQALIQTLTASAMIAQYFSTTSIFMIRVNFPRVPEPADFAKAEAIHWAENPPPQSCARLRTVEIAIKVNNRRDLLAFARDWLLFFPRGLPPNRRNILRSSEYLTIPTQ
jgi:hypothetical protein